MWKNNRNKIHNNNRYIDIESLTGVEYEHEKNLSSAKSIQTGIVQVLYVLYWVNSRYKINLTARNVFSRKSAIVITLQFC